MRWLARTLLLVAVGFGASEGCTSNHDLLAQKSSGGSGGSAASGTGGGDAGPDVADDSPADVFVEPTGKSVLTLLHGVVDAQHIAFCFAKVQDGVPAEPVGVPLPLGGLPWGSPVSVDAISGLDWTKDDIQPSIIAGDFTLLAGKTCSEAVALAASYAVSDAGDAGSVDASLDGGSDGPSDAAVELPPPPPLRAMALPVLPAGTVAGGYSTLLVATGCIGGPAFVDDLDQIVCGKGYAAGSPTLTPVLVQLSRVTAPSKVGLQALAASVPSDAVSFDSMPPEGSSLPSVSFASGVSFGQLSPTPPELGYAKADIGNVAESELQVSTTSSTLPVFESTWKSAFSGSALQDLADGSNYAVVLIGPDPSVPSAGKWWNPPRFAVVPTSP